MTAGGSVNVVDVNAEGEGVETTRTSFDDHQRNKNQNLPTNGRNFLDFATLAPMSSATRLVRAIWRSADRKEHSTAYRLTAQAAITLFRQSSGRVGSDALRRSFHCHGQGVSGQSKRLYGGIRARRRRSYQRSLQIGNKRLREARLEYFRDESLNARSPVVSIGGSLASTRTNQSIGGTFGGPIKKDKVFFFGAYEGQRSNLPNPVVLRSLPFAPASVQALLGPKIEPYNINREQDTFLVKADFNINERNQVWVRFNQQNFTGTNLNLRRIALSSIPQQQRHTSALTSHWTYTLRRIGLNEFRFHFSRDK